MTKAPTLAPAEIIKCIRRKVELQWFDGIRLRPPWVPRGSKQLSSKTFALPTQQALVTIQSYHKDVYSALTLSADPLTSMESMVPQIDPKVCRVCFIHLNCTDSTQLGTFKMPSTLFEDAHESLFYTNMFLQAGFDAALPFVMGILSGRRQHPVIEEFDGWAITKPQHATRTAREMSRNSFVQERFSLPLLPADRGLVTDFLPSLSRATGVPGSPYEIPRTSEELQAFNRRLHEGPAVVLLSVVALRIVMGLSPHRDKAIYYMCLDRALTRLPSPSENALASYVLDSFRPIMARTHCSILDAREHSDIRVKREADGFIDDPLTLLRINNQPFATYKWPDIDTEDLPQYHLQPLTGLGEWILGRVCCVTDDRAERSAAQQQELMFEKALQKVGDDRHLIVPPFEAS